MQKEKCSPHNLVADAICLLLFLGAIAAFFVLPLDVSLFIIPLFVVVSLTMLRRMKVWKCRACGYFFERD